jgi:Zn-dependent protease with chaperone function
MLKKKFWFGSLVLLSFLTLGASLVSAGEADIHIPALEPVYFTILGNRISGLWLLYMGLVVCVIGAMFAPYLALLGAVALLSDWTSRVRLGGPTSRRDEEGRSGVGGPLGIVLFVVWLAAVILAPLIGRVLATAVSRRREYLADASGAELTRNPLGLARALRKLSAARAPTASIHQGTAHLCITDPLAREVNERSGWLADLLATHPPLADRIERLEAMAYQGRQEPSPA